MSKPAILRDNLIICPNCGARYKNTLNGSSKLPLKTKCKKCAKVFVVEAHDEESRPIEQNQNNDEERHFSLFSDLLENPDQTKFMKMRELVYMHEDYSPYNWNVEKMEKLFWEKQYDKVVELYIQDRLNLFMSPRAHIMLYNILKQIGAKDKEEFHKMAADVLIDLLTKSGDGSIEHPFKVLRISDEYDVLMAIQEEKEVQELVFGEERTYDVIHTKSGKVMHFDITEAQQKK